MILVHERFTVKDLFCPAIRAGGCTIHSFSFVYIILRGEREREGSRNRVDQAEPELGQAGTGPVLYSMDDKSGQSIGVSFTSLCKYWSWTVTFQPFQMTLVIYFALVNNCLLPVIIVRFIVWLLFNAFIRCDSLFDSISLFSFHVHPVDIQFWFWNLFQVFRSYNNNHQASQ